MKNMDEVRTELTNIYNDLRAGKIKHHEAGEMNNSCGKIINSVKMELEYYALRKEPPNIPFLRVEPE